MAQRLCELTTQRFREHQLVEAVDWAYRTVRYCDLFATEDATFAAISTDTMQRALAWPVATRTHDDPAAVAGEYAERPVRDARVRSYHGAEDLAVVTALDKWLER
jgi:hypothetical protein